MKMRQGARSLITMAMAGAALTTGALTIGSSTAGAATAAPGVTSNSITVGTISTQTGTLAANFASLIYGEKAYYNYINSKGGVNGRKINYQYQLDDGGNPTTFNQLANTLINQDHVFAVTGVASAFFSPNVFVEAKVPTFGYNVTGNWSPQPNLFAAGGSVQYYGAEASQVAFVAQKTKDTKIAMVAYGVAASAAACQAAATGMAAAGYKIVYTDFKVAYPGSTVATDVQRMKQAGANFVLSCMDVQGNVTMARAIQQYGLKGTQLWLSGNDVPTLVQNQSLMQGVYFDIQHVPFTAPISEYPGLKLYMAQMKKTEPKYVYDEVAIQGWESAALFVQGVKMAGKNLTQANVVKQINSLTNFTAGSIEAPVNWKTAHSSHAPPYCSAYIVAKGTQFVPVFNTGKNVFNCFESTNPKKKPVFPVPAGTPS
ncbi:MAG TPA: ABC transporter substrate-binding protein [Acidimicrobiales bacterium]|jgi:ABC-type branched-subunit amino acid transport system substrate-binding protein|nr:ABC transporter substrate-binding protein [Acidimicrobiales bacterium]